jgi:hypothetical protein
MKGKNLYNLLAIVGLSLGLASGCLVLRQSQAQSPEVHFADASQGVPVNTTFTYQGHLTKGGKPVTGTCQIVFLMWDAPSGGNYLDAWGNSTDLKDGHFSLTVDFGPDAFTGDARWLETRVCCPAGSDTCETLKGRVELTAVPYAHSLRPGAKVAGATETTLHVSNSDADGVAVYGESTSRSTAVDDSSYGGKFLANSRYGTGVYGENTTAGEYDAGYGVYGKANSPNGYGVFSDGNARVDGDALVNGDLHVQGSLTWQSRTSFLSIPPAAFVPYRGIMDYMNNGALLMDLGNASPNYYAPVSLPHGALVTGLTFYWADYSSSYDATCTLRRVYLGGGASDMAQVASSGSSTVSFTFTDIIDSAYIDNSQYAYLLEWNLPYQDDYDYTGGLGVLLEYTYSEPH